MKTRKLAGDSVMGPIRRHWCCSAASALFPVARNIVARIHARMWFWEGGSLIFPWSWFIGVVRTTLGEAGADERS